MVDGLACPMPAGSLSSPGAVMTIRLRRGLRLFSVLIRQAAMAVVDVGRARIARMVRAVTKLGSVVTTSCRSFDLWVGAHLVSSVSPVLDTVVCPVCGALAFEDSGVCYVCGSNVACGKGDRAYGQEKQKSAESADHDPFVARITCESIEVSVPVPVSGLFVGGSMTNDCVLRSPAARGVSLEIVPLGCVASVRCLDTGVLTEVGGRTSFKTTMLMRGDTIEVGDVIITLL